MKSQTKLANESNVAGTSINHQYSKSYEFEKDFQNYAEYYLTDKIHYFSLLRCWNEYTICQKFLQFPQYLRLFRSCNAGAKENKWCGHCAKCLYVYIMLYPWVEKSTLQAIFGHDLLDDETLLDTFNGLVFPETIKPFECVGTKAEVCYTLDLAVQTQQICQNCFSNTKPKSMAKIFTPKTSRTTLTRSTVSHRNT